MQIFTELNKNPNLSLALGFFDGVHLGHQAVIKSAVNYAKENHTKSAVITFKDHPCCFLWNVEPKYILTRKDREEKIAQLGVDFLYELDFESISGLTAEDYLKDVLINNFTPSAISTGWNHNFGYKKSGNVKFLSENSKKFGYEYFELSPFKCNDEIISSTSVRKYLQMGKIEKANQMLGYNFSVSGKVIEGNKIGRTIGFKTANIDYQPELIEIPYGVYETKVRRTTKFAQATSPDGEGCDGVIKQKIYESAPTLTHIEEGSCKAIANYGLRPTVNGEKPILEVHILDFDKDIYGEQIQVEFIKKIRNEKKFSSLDELKEQIKKDLEII